MSLTTEMLLILGLILANGFFAAAEIAILTARRSRLEREAEAGNRSARVAVAGLILSRLERIPKMGEYITWHDLTLEVVDMDGPRIDRVLVTIPPKQQPAP